jgi:serine/threonine protein kinase
MPQPLEEYKSTEWLSQKIPEGIVDEIYRQLDVPRLDVPYPEFVTHFTLGNKIGQGSFGKVYKATQIVERDTITMAFKQIVGGSIFEKSEIEAADQEMKILVTLRHLNIVNMYWSNMDILTKDCKKQDVGMGYAMEYTDCGNLQDLIKTKIGGEWQISDRLKLFIDVAAGLNYLHTRPRQVLHRDLKSANVLVCRHHRDRSLVGKLCDFGVSKIAEATTRATQSDFREGTRRYTAPEYLQNDTKDYTASGDVYSLAMVGYELVTCKIPFHTVREDIDVFGLLKYENKKPDDLRENPPSACPTGLYDLIEKMWSSDVPIRPSARSVVIDLQRLLKPFGEKAMLQNATKLNKNARDLQKKGKYEEAEPLYKKSLEIRRKVLGENHPDLAQSLNDLAQLLKKKGKYEEAEPLYNESLKIRRKVLGEDHPDVAKSLSNLAELLEAKGKLNEAEPLYRQALAIKRKIYGEEHPSIAAGLNNLAGLLKTQGKYGEAEPLWNDAIRIGEKVLGKEHPDVAVWYNNLANLCRTQGKYDDAVPLYEQSISIFKKVLGKDHPNVATLLNNLAGLLKKQVIIFVIFRSITAGRYGAFFLF